MMKKSNGINSKLNSKPKFPRSKQMSKLQKTQTKHKTEEKKFMI